MTLAVMQPYIFPYIGYFQLVNAVDEFVFYDDVNFIKGGWINRNNILVAGKSNLFTISCKGISQNKLIKAVELTDNKKQYEKILRTIQQAYSKAPYYDSVFPLINDVFNAPVSTISEMAIESVKRVGEYLNLKTKFSVSSEDFPETREMERQDRLIEICKKRNASTYINAWGGRALYSKEDFQVEEIDLKFIKPNSDLRYKQFDKEFVPWLSIIDVLMFNSVEDVRKLLTQYTLI